jgi:sec-independent protein translocase protein TatA
MFGIGWQEIVVIVLVVLLLFGARRIPELMRSLGKGVREFKDGMKDLEKDVKDEDKKEPSDKQ